MCFPGFGIGAALSLASTAVSAAGSVIGGMMQQSQAKAQALAYDRQAELTQRQGDYEAQRTQEKVDAATGRAIAGANASGVTLAGSPTDVISSNVSTGALDIGAIKWNAKVQSDTFKYDAANARIQGQNAMAGGIVGGLGAVVGGLGKAGGQMAMNRAGVPIGGGFGGGYGGFNGY